MNYFVTLNIKTNMSEEELSTLFSPVNNNIPGIDIFGIDGITAWNESSSPQKTVDNAKKNPKES
ncbi:MAG: hypothetical protein IJ691_04565 [Lachnospiraceae bacterium]|nr:hypothetical protein [Lachnospiraceae bacterium]